MKNELKISTLSLVCVLCATAVSGAYGAASVRSLGGTGTYTSASSAASAGASGAMRGGSVRVTPTTGKTTATKAPAASATTGRVATTPRLSIGKYLPGGSSVSGGSSIKYPGGGGSASGGGGSMDPDSAAELKSDIRALQKDVADLQAADSEWNDALDAKQDALTASDGYITIENNEVFLEVDAVKEAIGSTGGGEIELIKTDTAIEWCNSDGVCNELIKLSELVGPAGPQGPAIDVDTMNNAIDAAITNKDWSDFAKAENLTALEATVASKADQSALNILSNTVRGMYSNDEIDTKLADKQPAGNYATTEQLGAYATTEQLSAKQDKLTAGANISIVDGVINTKGIATTEGLAELESKVGAHDTTLSTLDGSVKALDDQVGTITETVATVSDKADAAVAGLTAKADKSELTGLATKDELNAKADVSALDNLATKDEIPTVPTKVSAFENDKGYLTEHQSLGDYAKTADVAATYATKTDLAAKANAADVMTADQANATYATKEALADKQDKLTFDTTPTDGSTNPVTSGGVAQAIADAKISGEADLTNYATKQYVQDYVNIPTAAGSYLLTVNGDKKEWTEIKIVMPDGTAGQ